LALLMIFWGFMGGSFFFMLHAVHVKNHSIYTRPPHLISMIINVVLLVILGVFISLYLYLEIRGIK
jgi:hypothetical protein